MTHIKYIFSPRSKQVKWFCDHLHSKILSCVCAHLEFPGWQTLANACPTLTFQRTFSKELQLRPRGTGPNKNEKSFQACAHFSFVLIPHSLILPCPKSPVCVRKCGRKRIYSWGRQAGLTKPKKTQTLTFEECHLTDTHYFQEETLREPWERGSQGPGLFSGEISDIPSSWKERQAQLSLKVEMMIPGG